jgi:hypothetical protein
MGIHKVSPFPTWRGLFIFINTSYSAGMNTLLNLTSDMTRSRGLALILTPDKARAGITELIVAQILHSPLFVISGSEWLPAVDMLLPKYPMSFRR